MKAILIPVILLLLGTGGGVGAALFLLPSPDPAADPSVSVAETCVPAADAPAAGGDLPGHETAAAETTAGHDYVRLDNQFIVPVVNDSQVAAMVVLSLNLEVLVGQQDLVLLHEPRLRDLFLQVLFDHANTGGFEGMFTASSNMRRLRDALHQAAQEALGDVVTDVLITDIVRQDV